MIHFDHIEIHVRDAKEYTEFLYILFKGGRFKKISENSTYMFLTPDNLRFEVKESKTNIININLSNIIGFCLPCLRMKNAEDHIRSIKSINIYKIIDNPDGKCFFFEDYLGIHWHIKDYEILDIYTNI